MEVKPDKDEKVYFPNLNGLRAIGAFIVVIGHIEFLKKFWRLPYYEWFPVPGKIGVTLFFALSGFLITSLLLQELRVNHSVQLKKFYLRRMLRIWPLYYLVVLLSLFIFNQFGFFMVPGFSDKVFENLTLTNILILVFLLPNITHFYIPYADQRWSIVVEEQFYLMQPFIIKIFKKRKLLLSIFLLGTFSPEILSLIVHLGNLDRFISINILESLGMQLKYLACIAIGCIFSILYFKRDNVTRSIVFSNGVQYRAVAMAVPMQIGWYI